MATKKELLQQEVAKAVGAGKAAALETVDFNDPNRPKTCLEVDFPILPVNQVAIIEGNAGKPIYQMSKWWARRRSSVFRSMLIAAATKAPDDPSHAAKLVWDNYYANHQKKGAFKHLKVADIFMGGGTTLVEGSRLGMQMVGNDLNPVAWFVVKQELANVDLEQVKKLLADIEAEVKPQIMPYYYCDGPQGEKGTWTHLPTGKVMPADVDPLAIPRGERKDYKYEGPEIIYTFWAKHGPCQVTGCGHRTPIMTSPVMAVKTLTVKHWEHSCGKCGEAFDVEEEAARMAPDVPFYVAPTVAPYSVLDRRKGVICPHCGHTAMMNLGKGKNKKVELSLLVHPQWLAGEAKQDVTGAPYGGSAQDDVAATTRWDAARAAKIRLLEVRGALPDEVTDPETGVTFAPEKGTVPKKSHYACSACGTVQDVLTTIKATGKTGPMAAYAVQGYAPKRDEAGKPYGGRFFAAYDAAHAQQYDAAFAEWEARKDADLKDYWPRSELAYGFMTHHLQGGVPNHGFTHWWTMFNPRQLLVHAQLLKAIVNVGDYDWKVREYVLGAFQNFLRNQNSLAFWHMKLDKLAPAMSNSNFHPKNNVVEVGVFPPMGYGPWSSTFEVLFKGGEWAQAPWETVSAEYLNRHAPSIAGEVSGKSEKVHPGDPLLGAETYCGSSTELTMVEDASLDLVITDPPFGGLLHYSELSDFFYVWLRLALKDKYPDYFRADYTPKSLEAVANRAREPEDPDGFYQRLLTQCWREAHRALKPSGILAFTFHHSEDEPWVAVLESLFDAGYYLEATYLKDNYDSPAKLKKYWGYLANNVVFIQISTDVSSALKIFETINERGVGLNPMDLLKNLLFTQVKQAQFTQLKDEWKKITKPLEKEKEKPLRFLRYFLMANYVIKNDRGDAVVREDEIYDWFVGKDNAALCDYAGKPFEFVRKVIRNVEHYLAFSNGLGNDGKPSLAMDSLKRLAGGAFSLHYVLLLAAASFPKPLFDHFVAQLESFLFYYIFTKTPTKDLERSFSQWADELRAIAGATDPVKQKVQLNAFIADRFDTNMAGKSQELVDALRRFTLHSMQQYRTRYLLARLTQHIEMAFSGLKTPGSLEPFTNLEIEHILPNKPEADLRSKWATENPGMAYDDYKNRLGNLTLLEKPINIVAGNDFYTAKQAEYRKSGNYLTRSLVELTSVGQNTSISRINEKLKAFPAWNAKAIEERHGLLITLAQDVWKTTPIDV